MHAWPDAPAVSQFLARAARRLTWLAMLRGASIGLAAAALLVVVGWLRSWAPGATVLMAVGLVVAAVAVAILRSGRAMNAVAGRVERRAPACRNLIVTAAEIVARPDGVRAYIGARVCRDAAATIARLDLASLFPAGRTAAVFVVALTLASAATLALVARAPVPAVLDLPGLRPGGVLHQVAITITPPPYTGRPTERLADPDTVTVLAGSRIDVVVHGRAREASLESRDSRAILARNADGTFAGAITADADGFLAIDVRGDTPADAARRLIGVRVTTDARPAVRIVTPGKDLLVPDTARTIALSIAATDDLGLAALGLRYTRVTGSGENFTFTDDELPVVITREDERTWRATASLPLAPLALEPGDMIVYRAIARDHRPGAAAAESDAFIIELVAPGHVASEGFAIDDQADRYAISQQMVILKTERLIARRATLSAEALAEEAHLLAAEQRMVRAEFVFMMGGHIEDEEVEAAGEEEIAAGRLENRGRVDLVRAIRAMSEAATSLTAVELTQALADERRALASLQLAFSRSRYILRTLSVRERIDEARRSTGTLAGVGRDVRTQGIAPGRPRADALRQALTEALTLGAPGATGAPEASRLDALGAAVLRIDPAAEPLRQIAARVNGAAARLRAGDAAGAAEALAAAAAALSTALATELATGVGSSPDATGRLLDGALADALKRSGGR